MKKIISILGLLLTTNTFAFEGYKAKIIDEKMWTTGNTTGYVQHISSSELKKKASTRTKQSKRTSTVHQER